MKKYTFQILILAALVLTACGGNNEAAENSARQSNELAGDHCARQRDHTGRVLHDRGVSTEDPISG